MNPVLCLSLCLTPNNVFCIVVEAGTPWKGNDTVERHLAAVERVGLSRGLSPQAVSILLEFSLSLRMGSAIVNMQVLFVRWVLTVFDLIDSKDQLRAIYGFIFNFVTEENLCPYICHLLYLLTRKENVRPYRVRKLLELQTRMGCQPFLMHLLSVYKVYCPELVTISVPAKMKVSSIQSQSRLSGSKVFPLEQLRTFSQLLENLHRIELPAQMGSLLGSTVALHFLDCVRDSSAFLRLNFWLGHLLHEEFIFCKDGGTQDLTEATGFLNTLISTQCFLQEGFAATELFLYKFLNIWDGSLLRPEILGLLSNIPLFPFTGIKTLLFEPLMQLFFTSSLFFKCSVIECLTNMLLKWLTWHSVNMTLSGLMDSVVELVHFVGRISTIGLQLEGYHSLLLSFTLDFYMMVSDMYLKYDLPLVLMPPAGVFYPALFATDPVNLDKLCHIMYRYRTNLMSAKNQEQKMKKPIEISRKTYHEFNQYVVSMVSCLWNSRAFQPGMGLEMDEGLLSRSGVPEPWTRFSLVYHPAFLGYAVDFHENCWPERMKMDLSSIKLGKRWDWYVEFLYCQGLQGLKEFMQSSLRRQSSVGGTRATSDSQSQPPS
uniref:Centromere protein I n=1 Tax=Scleropages formosus TaxID=113540 RepID=A0A8C9VJV0_SCLFO